MAMALTSEAFEHGKPIPKKYTADGADVSPPLRWSNVPEGTKSFALICDDPDGGAWVHWVACNIPAATSGLDEGASSVKAGVTLAGKDGKNSWETVGWQGPDPPSGTHRYIFKLYALDAELALPAGADKPAVLKAIEGHVLATAELMGTYKR